MALRQYKLNAKKLHQIFNRLLLESNGFWSSFEDWLLQSHSRSHARDILRYAKRFAFVLEDPRAASQLLGLSKSLRRIVMASLSNLSKYLGVYEYWKQIIRAYGLKWKSWSGLEAFLSIVNTNLSDVKDWLKQVMQRLPINYSTALAYTALTGLRPTEACISLRLISDLAESGMLDSYLNRDLMMLEHYKFPKLFLRKSKNAYISFITPELLNLVLDVKPRVKYSALDTKIGRLGFKTRVKYLRKLYATTLRNSGVPQEFIDLVQGRIGQSIFIRFYYKPLLQQIRSQATQAIEPLQKELLPILQ